MHYAPSIIFCRRFGIDPNHVQHEEQDDVLRYRTPMRIFSECKNVVLSCADILALTHQRSTLSY